MRSALTRLLSRRGLPSQDDGHSSRAWQDYTKSPDTHPQIPNVSYAGYRRGESPIPSKQEPLFNVKDHGAMGDGLADDTAAFHSAIEEAGRCGGGVVYAPAGTYMLSEVLWIHHSHVVLRGAGTENTTLYFSEPLERAYRAPLSGEWSWTGGLVWFIPEILRRDLETSHWAWGSNEGWTDTRLLTEVRGGASRGATRVRVKDSRGFTAGDHVLLVMNNIADASLLNHMCGDLPQGSYDWGGNASSLHRQPNYQTFRWPVQVKSVRHGSIELAQPLRLDLRQVWRPRFESLGSHIEESGIEDLRIQMRPAEPRPHNQDMGFNGPHFQASLNCWARNVVVRDSDNGFGLSSSKNVTLTNVSVEGRARHHPFICREQSHDNLVERFRISAPTTPLPAGSLTHGINVEGYSSGNVWCDGRMDGTFDSHRRLPFDNVRTKITVRNSGVVGGAKKAGPHWGARFCHWNVIVTNGRSYAIRLETHAPYSAMVGIQGTNKESQQKLEFTGDLHTVIDALGVAPEPDNLYEAQLAHRLTRSPGNKIGNNNE